MKIVAVLILAFDREICVVVCDRKALFEKDGLAIWAKVLKGALRSSAFLGLYCTLCWRGACVGFQATRSASPPVIAASCWTGAVATAAPALQNLTFSCAARAHVHQPNSGCRCLRTCQNLQAGMNLFQTWEAPCA